jgi:hypothetical protein
VEPTQITAAADDACAAAVKGLTRCPQAPNSPGHFFDPQDYTFCSCDKASNARDSRPLPWFSLYAEDADRTEEGDPLDELFGAFLLDPAPAYEPDERVAYTAFLDPTSPAPDALPVAYDDAIGRPAPALRDFTISDENGEVDLCNGNLGDELDWGWHTVQFIVTDRPWFTPEQGAQQVGVPDLAAGATYDTTAYTFFCHHWEADPEVDPVDCSNQCVIPED